MCESASLGLVVDTSGNPLDMGRRQRRASGRLRRALVIRDGNRCQAPGCTRTGYLHAHHVVWWTNGGSTDLGNLLLLCSKHHHYVHEGGWTIRKRGRQAFEFYDKWERLVGPTPLIRPTGALPIPAETASVQARDGGRLNRHYVMGVLLTARERARASAAAAASHVA
jgi:hypothetical protein